MRKLKRCIVCGKEFDPFPNDRRKTCSVSCLSDLKSLYRSAQLEKRIVKHCVYCGKAFLPQYRNKQYCSDECMVYAEKARKASKKQKHKPNSSKPLSQKTLEEIANEAAEQGMSYGEYMQKVYRETLNYER